MFKLIGNLIWLIFGGLWLALTWFIAGCILCITIIGIPFGMQCFKIAKISLWPYGRKIQLNFAKHPVANVIWAVLGGWELALVYLFVGIINCITIIGIPGGIQCFKIMKIAFFPFGATSTNKGSGLK